MTTLKMKTTPKLKMTPKWRHLRNACSLYPNKYFFQPYSAHNEDHSLLTNFALHYALHHLKKNINFIVFIVFQGLFKSISRAFHMSYNDALAQFQWYSMNIKSWVPVFLLVFQCWGCIFLNFVSIYYNQVLYAVIRFYARLPI